jgi:hypothetical protein
MARTPEERRETDRRNAQRSTGPKTAEGKARARVNALKHGLRAEDFALPGEDQEQLKRLTEEWVEYYEPRSPGERAVLDRCVHATVQLQRCARFQAETVTEQIRTAYEDWHNTQEDELEELKGRLETEPSEAVRLLKRSSLGCRWMLQQWTELRAVFEGGKTWVVPELHRAIRLLGVRSETEQLRAEPIAFLVNYYNLLSWARPSDATLAWLTDPKRMPDTLVRDLDTDNPPDRATSRAWIVTLVDQTIAELKAIEVRLRTEIELPSLEGLMARSSLLGGPEGALLARYERMHDLAYHRAYKALLKGELQHEDEDKSTPAALVATPAHLAGTAAVLDITAAKTGAPNEATEEVAAGAESVQKKTKPDAPQSFERHEEVLEGVVPVTVMLETADPPGSLVS